MHLSLAHDFNHEPEKVCTRKPYQHQSSAAQRLGYFHGSFHGDQLNCQFQIRATGGKSFSTVFATIAPERNQQSRGRVKINPLRFADCAYCGKHFGRKPSKRKESCSRCEYVFCPECIQQNKGDGSPICPVCVEELTAQNTSEPRRKAADKVVIIGAGIGGLALANACLRRGMQVEVYERSPTLRAIGAGIQLQPNAIKALYEIDPKIAARVASLGAVITTGGFQAADGEWIYANDVSENAAALGLPDGIAIGRRDVTQALFDALPAGTVRFAHTLTAIDQSERGVRVTFADGAVAEGDVLIGADGIRSTVRGFILPEAPGPQTAGYTCWVAMTDFPQQENTWSELHGLGTRFGYFSSGDNRMFWYAFENGVKDQPDPQGSKQKCLEISTAFIPLARQMVESTDETNITRLTIRDLNPMPTWTSGRITLLGDAAHACTPNLGQGGCMAIEDAHVLAAALANHETVSDAFANYELRRIRRTTKVTEGSRQTGMLNQLGFPFARWLRKNLYRFLGDQEKKTGTMEFDYLYTYRL